jgi:peptide/nickel transport system substrate-binding protein
MTEASRRAVLAGLAGGIGGFSGWTINQGGRAWAQGQPKRIVGALEEDPPVICPPMTSIISSFGAGCAVYGALTWVDTKGQIHPELAERWEISPDGRTYTFYLRKNVVWHDDKPFTSADVKFTMENVTSKFHPWGRGAFKTLDHVDASDPHIAVFKLKTPSPAVMKAVNNAIAAILPKHLWEGTEFVKNPLNKKPIGTGPFKLVEYVQGDRIRYVRNEKYYIPGQPAFDEMVLRIIPDAAARVAAFEKGEVDMLYNNSMPFTEIERIKKFPNVEIKASNVSGAAFLGIINGKSKPYDDVRVRQAVAHGINRAFIRDNVMPGFSELQVGPLPPAFGALVNSNLKDYEYDPAKANKILDEAGYARKADGTRFEFRLLWPAHDIRVTKMADVIRQNLSEVGIAVSLQPLERAALNQKGFVGEQFDMLIDSYAQGPDPDIGTERLYITTNIHNPPRIFTNNSSYSNPELDKLFEEQRLQVDPAKRKEIYDRISEIVWAAVPVLPILAYSGVGAFRNSVMTNAYESADASKESFARVRLPALVSTAAAATPGAAAPASGQPAGGGGSGGAPTTAIAAAGAAVVAAGAYWLWRRKSRADLDDRLDEKHS